MCQVHHLCCILEPPNCVEGMAASELKRFWEERDHSVLYNTPEADIPLNCQSALISRILVGAYNSLVIGDGEPEIVIGTEQKCSVSSEPITEGVNVFGCVFDFPVQVTENSSLSVRQRNSSSQIGLLYDGYMDTPLISVDSK